MTVTVNEVVAAELARETQPVPVRDPAGKLVGFIDPLPEFEMSDEEAMRLADDPNTKWVSGDEVMARLREIDRRGL